MTEHPDDQLADGELDEADQVILRGLRATWTALDPPPAGLAERLRFGLMMDAMEAELASLTRLEPALAGVRSGALAGSTVTFTHRDFSAIVRTATGAGETVSIEGWVTAAPATGVELVLDADPPRRAVVDDTGHFQFDDVRRGLVRFTFHRPGSSVIVTPAMEV